MSVSEPRRATFGALGPDVYLADPSDLGYKSAKELIWGLLDKFDASRKLSLIASASLCGRGQGSKTDIANRNVAAALFVP
jgi:hypothetical protein